MKKFFIITLIVFLSSCAYNSGVIQKDNISYLKLVGKLQNISLQIDDGAITQLNEISIDTVYEIKPGVHIIKVRRDSKLVIERKLYFGNQITREVKVK